MFFRQTLTINCAAESLNYIIGERYSNDPIQSLRNSEISISEKFRVQSVLRPH